jgi:hypothetical protein
MKKICTNCNYQGSEITASIYYAIIPTILTLGGTAFLRDLNTTIEIIAPLIWLLVGLYSLYIFLKKPNRCPNCKKKKTMIPLDTPKAVELIKEKNLTLPEQTQA